MKNRWPVFILAAALFSALLVASCASHKNTAQSEERSEPAPGSATTRPEQPQPRPSDQRPVIVAFGDSLTAGVASPTYPEQLQDLIDAHHLSFRVENQGVSGDTTTDGLARIDNVLAVKPVLVILEFGGNDGLRGIPVSATRKNLSEMIERIQSAHIPLALLGITLPPNYGPDYVKPFTATFPALAHEYHIPFIPFVLVHVYQYPELMQPDGIHPNGAGNKIVARDVFDLIRPMLADRKSAHS